MNVRARRVLSLICGVLLVAGAASAQATAVTGQVRDETGSALPGVSVVLRGESGAPVRSVTDGLGMYYVDSLRPGRYSVEFTLINFATFRRSVNVGASVTVPVDVVMHLALSADVTVTGKATFTNLADVERPAENLVGIAESSSQGAITSRQLETRPVMRTGEVLETVPGVVISQHSGEGKANQYYLRGFNLDHGTDFATTVAGMPVNMPTHAHGHGYSDLNFLIPELVSGVQFSKGPYFADQGDFATAGAANINYVTTLERPLARLSAGGQGYERGVFAASPRVGAGFLLGAIDVEHNDGPWTMGDNYRKVNGLLRYTRGDSVNGLTITGMGYRGTWNSTDQIPARAISDGLIGRFAAIDPTDGGDTYRYSGSLEWQRTHGRSVSRLTAYGIGYDLNLFSNFTYFLDDPVNGDQFHQADHRFVSGFKASHRRLEEWGGRPVQNTFGIQVRNDDITTLGLTHTVGRQLLDLVREDRVLQTSAGLYAQNEVAWQPWLRTLAGVRVDGYRFNVHAGNPVNGGIERDGLASPKGGVVIGPFGGTEVYANAGYGFHSNDARGATITVDPSTGAPADRVTPLVRARGAEVGVRTVAVPHLQTSVTWWSLSFDSELVFAGDAGTTEAGRPSHRYGVELANYYSPRPWLILDGDVSLSRAHFTDADPIGSEIPGAVETVVSAGATLDALRNVFGSVRVRYFGPRPLIEDNSVRSQATMLVNAEMGYRVRRHTKIGVDIFNLLNAADSDVDYFYASRLPSEPSAGIDDIHFHPAIPRMARLTITFGF